MKEFIHVFVFDTSMFQYYLEKIVGKVEMAGISYKEDFTLAFRQTRDEGFAKAELQAAPGKIVWGVVYRLSKSKFRELRKLSAKNSDIYFCDDRLPVEGNIIDVKRPYLKESLQSYGNLPKDWYKNIMVEGASRANLPEEYKSFLADMPVEAEIWIARKRNKEDLLYYPDLIQKNLIPAAEEIARQDKSHKYKGVLNGHAFHAREFLVEKGDKEYKFQTNTNIPLGVQTHKELRLGKQVLKLKRAKGDIYVPGKNLLLTNIKYGDRVKYLTGTFSSFSTIPTDQLDGHYCRMLIPIETDISFRQDFQVTDYIENGKLHINLLDLEINSVPIHFYQQKIAKQEYLIIDALAPMVLRRFLETVHSIQLVYALLRGEYLSGEARVFFYNEPAMETIVASYFHTMQEAIYGLPGIFTANGYYGINNDEDSRDDNGKLTAVEHEKARVEIKRISFEIFSNLCNEIISSEKILRSILILITTQKISLESRIPSQYVALEALTATFVKGGNKELKPIKDDAVAAELVSAMKATLDQFSKDKGFSKEEDEKLNPLRRKLTSFNEPPNADKLSESFKVVGYKPNSGEEKVIKLRNKFLHGSTIDIDFENNEDYGFKELFHISLRLHMLLAILLLRKAGYSGKIVNYVKLYAHIIEMDIEEERFKDI